MIGRQHLSQEQAVVDEDGPKIQTHTAAQSRLSLMHSIDSRLRVSPLKGTKPNIQLQYNPQYRIYYMKQNEQFLVLGLLFYIYISKPSRGYLHKHVSVYILNILFDKLVTWVLGLPQKRSHRIHEIWKLKKEMFPFLFVMVKVFCQCHATLEVIFPVLFSDSINIYNYQTNFDFITQTF